MTSIEQEIRKFIADNILFSNHYPYPDELSFLENGIVDSMNIMELVMYVEEKYGVKVNDEEIIPENFDSVSSIATFVRSKNGR